MNSQITEVSVSASVPLSAVKIERLAMAPNAPVSVDEAKRTVDVLVYSGAGVDRFDYFGRYQLFIDVDGIDLARVKNGTANVLDSHQSSHISNVVGIVESAWKRNGQLHARLRFSERPEVNGVWSDVKSGILRGISIGLTIREATEERDHDGRVSKRTIAKSELIDHGQS